MPYDDSWDVPHTPTSQAFWQESDCYWAYDAAKGVGLFHRVGQYVNQGSGQIHLFVFKTGGQRFKLLTMKASGPRERWERGQQVGTSIVDALGGGRMRYRWSEPDAAGDVEFYDSFHTPRDWHTPTVDAKYDSDMHDGGHLEVAGRLRGTIRIGGETVEIDALAHRDRSWGSRTLGESYQHRMCTGTIGPELSWATVLVQFNGGKVVKMGYVARGGQTEQLRDVRFLTTTDYDSLSVVGAVTRLELDGGEVIEIRSRTEQGFLNGLMEYTYGPDTIMSLTHGGKPGFCYHTAAFNPAKGRYLPTQQELASICVEEGLSQAAPIPA